MKRPSRGHEHSLTQVKGLIQESYEHPNRTTQEAALKASLKFFSSRGKGLHIFCAAEFEKPAITTLLLFAYPNSVHLTLYQDYLKVQLAKCPKCPRNYHLMLIKFENILTEKYKYDKAVASELLASIQKWDQYRLLISLRSIFEKSKILSNLQLTPKKDLQPLFECLYCPRLLKDANLLIAFRKVFFQTQPARNPAINPSTLLPGVVSFLFSSHMRSHVWAELTVANIKDSDASTSKTFDVLLMQAMDDVVKNISESQPSDEELKRFWYIFSVLIRVLDKSVFTKCLKGRQYDIIKYLSTCILNQPRYSLPAMLLALGNTLEKVGTEFWAIIRPTSLQIMLDAIVESKYLLDPRCWAGDDPKTSFEYRQDAEDVISWIIPWMKSVDQSDISASGMGIISMLARRIDQLNGTGDTEVIVSEFFDVFCLSLRVEVSDTMPFVNELQQTQRLGVNYLAYKFGSRLIGYYKGFNSAHLSITERALEIFYWSILLNVMSASFGENSTPSQSIPVRPSSSLWTQLNMSFLQDAKLAISVLRAMTHVSFVVYPPTQPQKHGEIHKLSHSKLCEEVLLNAAQSLDIIGLFDKEVLMIVLEDNGALLSIICNILSADNRVSQSAVDVLCQAFNVCDRQSAFLSLLKYDLQRSLISFSTAFKKAESTRVFAPCPKLIKVSKDLLQCFFGAHTGIFDSKSIDGEYGLSPGKSNELFRYWDSTWILLAIIYQETPKWTVQYKNDFMLEFMRDLLDYSQELIGYFRFLQSIIPGEAYQHTPSLLLRRPLECLEKMTPLLRLKDEALISSCTNMIVSVLKLFGCFHAGHDENLNNLAKTFAQMAAKARGFENILSSYQLTQLLVYTGVYAIDDAERLVVAPVNNIEGNPNLLSSGFEEDKPSANVSEGTDKNQNVTRPQALRKIESKKSTPTVRLEGRHSLTVKEKKEKNRLARSFISMEPFYEEVLRWDYHAKTPNPIKLKTRKPFSIPSNKIPSKFKSITEYQIFNEPLLMMQCWQNILYLKDDSKEKAFKIQIANKITIDETHIIRVFAELFDITDCNIKESDLLVLSYFSESGGIAKFPHPEVPHCFAKVNQIKKSANEYVELVLRIDDPTIEMEKYLETSFELHVLKVASFETLEKEFFALQALPYYDFYQEILNASSSEVIPLEKKVVSDAASNLSLSFSQASAVLSSQLSQGFFLIPGYPGTGKTKTLVKIIQCLLAGASLDEASPVSLLNAASQVPSKQILVCAPSDSAVDSIAIQFKNDIKDANSKNTHLRFVRFGPDVIVNDVLTDSTLDSLVDKKLSRKGKKLNEETEVLRQDQLENIIKRDDLMAKLNRGVEPDAVRQEIQLITKKIKDTTHKLDLLQDKERIEARTYDIDKKKIESTILRQAHVIFTTLSDSVHPILSSLHLEFDTIIIDDATQCEELSALIPLGYGYKRCIMTGAPKQSPATSTSLDTPNYLKYDQSLFGRMIASTKNPPLTLTEQFRMHPDIARFPIYGIYNNKMHSSPTNLSRTSRWWHKGYLTPYRFFNVMSFPDSNTRSSFFSRAEAQLAFQLYQALTRVIGRQNIIGKVGIISVHKQQVMLMKNIFQSQLGNSVSNGIDFNTVDELYGQEKEIIILSCVRGINELPGVGLLHDPNIIIETALTRAAAALWIVGHEPSLANSLKWKALIQDAKKRRLFTDCTPGFLKDDPSRNLDSSEIIVQPSTSATREIKPFNDGSGSTVSNPPRLVRANSDGFQSGSTELRRSFSARSSTDGKSSATIMSNFEKDISEVRSNTFKRRSESLNADDSQHASESRKRSARSPNDHNWPLPLRSDRDNKSPPPYYSRDKNYDDYYYEKYPYDDYDFYRTRESSIYDDREWVGERDLGRRRESERESERGRGRGRSRGRGRGRGRESGRAESYRKSPVPVAARNIDPPPDPRLRNQASLASSGQSNSSGITWSTNSPNSSIQQSTNSRSETHHEQGHQSSVDESYIRQYSDVGYNPSNLPPLPPPPSSESTPRR